MSKIAIPVIQFLFKAEFKSLDEALRLNPNYDVEAYSSASDLATYLSTIPAGLVIASLIDKNDLIQIATFMKLQKKVAKNTVLKIVVINFSNDRNFEKAISKLGILDVVDPSTNTKALKFKLDFWMKSLSAQVKQNPSLLSQKVVKSQESQDKEKSEAQTPVWTDPLELEDDIWILKADSDCKRILGKWLIRLMGPGPYVGQWFELKPNLWRFDLKASEKDMFVPNQGAWYFSGDQKPDFVWKENCWLMTGDSFDLFFKSDNKIYSRLKSKDKALTIAKNSLYARTKEQVIQESFDKDLVFKKEAITIDDLEGEGKSDSLSGRLEGKNKTDTLEIGNLEGKNKTPAERSGNLKGKLESQDSITHDDLDLKADNKKEKTYWNGKNAYEKDGKAGEFGVRKDELNDSPELAAPKDNEHKKYYKNQNEASLEKEEDQDKERKPNTDHLKKHYSSPAKSSVEKEQKEASELEEVSAEESAERERKSRTDHLNKHYSGETKSREPLQAEKEKSHPIWNDKEPSYRGHGETDLLSSHYGGKKDKSAKEKDQKENSEYDDLFSGVDEKKEASRNVVDLEKVRREKTIEATKIAVSEAGLEELTKDAKVISFLTHQGEKVTCELNDFFDDTIIFLTDAKGIKNSSEVFLDLAFKFLEKDKELKLSGNVVSIDDDGEGKNYITVQLSKENTMAFEVFMKLYESRQSNVTEFLKRARGL